MLETEVSARVAKIHFKNQQIQPYKDVFVLIFHSQQTKNINVSKACSCVNRALERIGLKGAQYSKKIKIKDYIYSKG